MTVGALVTIGHSTHDLSTFERLLRRHEVTAVADVRSVPVSRFTPQFNRDALVRRLREIGIAYVFMGAELGARTADTSCYVDGRVQYGRLAQTTEFARGVERLLNGSRSERIAIMCTEAEPLDCHRTILIAQVLAGRGVVVGHIRNDGQLEEHAAAMERLMVRFGLAEDDLFRTADERLDEALVRQERRIAYVNKDLRVGGAADT